MDDYHVKTYENLSHSEKEIFFDFCRHASREIQSPASKNMWIRNTFVKPWTLGYRLESSTDFNEPNGKFYILYDHDEVIGCSGIRVSDFHPLIFAAGVRTWIKKEYRNQSLNKKYFFPIQKKWAIEKNAKIIFLSFNDYNKNLIEVFKRNRLGEKNNRLHKRDETDLFSNGVNIIKYPLIIFKTKQWICYEKIDDEFDYDWSKLTFSDNNQEMIYTKHTSSK